MEKPIYEGVVEQWKVDAIIQQAKALGFAAHELPDLQQEIVMMLLEFSYDPAWYCKAAERTVVTAAIIKKLRCIRRKQRRYQDHVGAMPEDFDQVEPEAGCIHLAAAVRDVIEALPERHQHICRCLMGGMSRHQIARQLRCSWYTVERVVKLLRERFLELGLAQEVGQ